MTDSISKKLISLITNSGGMKYKGVIFAFGANSTIKCLEPLRRGEVSGFDEVREVEPSDSCSLYKHFGEDRNLIYEANLRPVECRRDHKKILLCPTRATVLNEEPGSAKRRIKAYSVQSEKSISIGYVGSNKTEYSTGDIILPSVGVCSGILLEHLGEEDHFAAGIVDVDIADEIKFLLTKDHVEYRHGCAIMSVADYQDSVNRGAESMWMQGFSGRDMETAWFLGYSRRIGKPAASILVVSDFAGDGNLKDPKKSKPLELSQKAEDSMGIVLKTAIEALFL